MSDNFNKGNEYFQNQQYEEAIECYDKVIKLEPNNVYAYYNKGKALGSLERYEEAFKSFDKVIKLEPNNSSAYLGKGISLSILEKNKEAIECFKKVIECGNAIYHTLFFLMDMHKKDKTILSIENINKKLKLLIEYTPPEESLLEDNKLYSYMPFNKDTINSIVKGYKYASSIFDFNDPTDPIIRMIEFDNKEELSKKLLKDIRIACFSTTPTNMLMYSHYADKHKGICIEYDLSNFNKDKMVLRKMKYSDTLYIDKDNYMLSTMSNDITVKETLLIDLFNTKHDNWKYEDEYRIITYAEDKIKLPIKAIYMGMKMDDDDKTLLKKLVDNNTDIQLYNVKANKNNLGNYKHHILMILEMKLLHFLMMMTR